MEQAPPKILALCGSLREGSYNLALLNVIIEKSSGMLDINLWDNSQELPRLDFRLGRVFPKIVEDLRERALQSDGVIIATPEFNRSIPGYLKDLIDWLSIRPVPGVLTGKPVAIVSASTGPFGGAFAQQALTQLLRAPQAHVVTNLDLVVPNAPDMIKDGRIDDPELVQRIESLIGKIKLNTQMQVPSSAA